jgi:ISXO2-like transposase domain
MHTNSIEGAWSLFRTGNFSIQHHVSEKHLRRYLDEFSFRYNTRDYHEGQRMNHFLSPTNGRLKYKELIE